MYSNGTLHMDEQRLEPTYSCSVPIRDVALRTCRKQWTIGWCGERGSEISVLIARYDDIYIYIYIYIYIIYIYIYIYIYYEGHTISFQTFFVREFKILVDSWQFSMLLLYILWDDRPISMILGPNELLQQQLEYILLKPNCHSW